MLEALGGFTLDLMLDLLNMGLMLGLTLGVILLLRPLLVRLLSPQQRVVLWLAAYLPGYIPGWYKLSNCFSLLPVTFRSLVVARTGSGTDDLPNFLPGAYRGTGSYNLALPGGTAVQVSLTDGLMWGAALLLAGGIVALTIYESRREERLIQQARRGRLVPRDDPLLQGIPVFEEWEVAVRLCANLPTSFVRRGRDNKDMDCAYVIYLQEELPPQQLRLVLLHEAQHIRLRHCWSKGYVNASLLLHWWNPLVWLCYRYACRDMELACDRAVMDRLTARERKDYAKTLLELGTGRQLWEAALSFGECDGALRVRAAAGWRPRPGWKKVATGALACLVVMFFMGGPDNVVLPQDILLSCGGSQALYRQVDQVLERSPQGAGQRAGEVWTVWESPGYFRWMGRWDDGLWVRTRQGQWFRIQFYYRSRTEEYMPVGNAELREAPSLSAARRLA